MRKEHFITNSNDGGGDDDDDDDDIVFLRGARDNSVT